MAEDITGNRGQTMETRRGPRSEGLWTWMPLDRYQNEFRLLDLLGYDEEDGYMICSLRHYSLSRPPPYAALSWTWGDGQDKLRTIIIGNRRVRIPEALFQALSALYSYGHHTLWVDALCIDQTNLDEKGAQVLRMATVFSQAQLVAVWLGTEANGSSTIMEMIEQYGDEEEEFPEMFPASTLWSDFVKFFGRPYWRRVWIVQEIVVATRIVVYCGHTRAQGTAFENLFGRGSIFPSIPEYARSLPDLSHVSAIWQIRENRCQRQPMGLLEIINQTSVCLASNPLDRVYALLGLGHDQSVFVSEPDYRISARDLCILMTKKAIAYTRTLDFVFLAEPWGTQNYHLPSWCPNYLRTLSTSSWLSAHDLSSKSERDAKLDQQETIGYLSGQSNMYRLGKHCSRWSASGKSRTEYRLPGHLNDLLQVPGWRLASIHALTSSFRQIEPYQNGAFHAERSSGSQQVIDSLCRLLSGHCSDCHENLTVTRKGLVQWWIVAKKRMRGRMATADIEYGFLRDWLTTNRHLPLLGKELSSHLDHVREQFQIKGLKSSSIEITTAMERTLDCARDMRIAQYRLMTTFQGHLGWAPPRADIDDEIYILPGCSMPVILRPEPDHEDGGSQRYRYIGTAIVDGVMHGEIWNKRKEKDSRTIEIV